MRSPYTPPEARIEAPERPPNAALKGATYAFVCSYIAAQIFAFTFRVPIPFGKYIGPFGQVDPFAMGFENVFVAVTLAWVFYGLLGGFLIVPLLGVFAGRSAARKYEGAQRARMIALYACVAGVAPVLGLCVLDYVIGPW